MSTGEQLPQPSKEETWHHNPESWSYITVNEPYNDTIIQFNVLKQMGYPVELQTASPMEFPEQALEEKYIQWEINRYPDWVRPVVVNREFDKFVDPPDVPGDSFRFLDEETQDLLFDHPMRLIAEVDYGSVSMNAYSVYEWRENGKVPHLKALHNESLITGELLEKCFVTSFNRFLDKIKSGCPIDDHEIPDEDDIKLYSELMQKGQKPITPEELSELVRDYYQLIEKLVPEFEAFKQTATS